MSPIDSINSQDDNFPMDLWMTSEPDLVKTSNVKPNFLQQKQKMLSQKIQLYFPPIPMIPMSPTNNNSSENTKGKSHITNEASENISDAKNPSVLNDAKMLPTDSNTSQDNDTQMDNVQLDKSSISEPNVVETSNVETKSFAIETQKIIPNNTIVPSTDSQDNDTQMDLWLTNESWIIEPNIVVSSNVETKSFPTETKKTSQITQLYLPQIPKIMILKWTFDWRINL